MKTLFSQLKLLKSRMIKKRTETKRLKCLIIYLGVSNHYRTSSQFSEVFLSNILFQSVVYAVREVTGQAVVVISHHD